METIEIYNYLDGKNLCNFFANLVVEELKKHNPDTKTEISVVNSRNFFVVRGRTNSDNVINLTNVFNEGLKRVNFNWGGFLNVIDTIHYNHEFKEYPLFLNLNFDTITQKDIQDFVNGHAKDELYFNIKIDNFNNIVTYDCKGGYEEKVMSVLFDKFYNYKIIKSDFSNEVYISDKYYGLSMNQEKPYHILLKNISNHISHMQLSKSLSLGLFSDKPYEEIDNENVILKIKNEKNVIKNEWLKSLVLDLFSFEQNEIIDKYGLKDYNCESELLPEKTELPFDKLHKISEFVLF
jgi:hypothetical protein